MLPLEERQHLKPVLLQPTACVCLTQSTTSIGDPDGSSVSASGEELPARHLAGLVQVALDAAPIVQSLHWGFESCATRAGLLVYFEFGFCKRNQLD